MDPLEQMLVVADVDRPTVGRSSQDDDARVVVVSDVGLDDEVCLSQDKSPTPTCNRQHADARVPNESTDPRPAVGVFSTKPVSSSAVGIARSSTAIVGRALENDQSFMDYLVTVSENPALLKDGFKELRSDQKLPSTEAKLAGGDLEFPDASSPMPKLPQNQSQLFRQQKPTRPSHASTTYSAKMGLDHLDNLCRLMEQLTDLKDQNVVLQRRVQYLEDMKMLHYMQRELQCETPDASVTLEPVETANNESNVWKKKSTSATNNKNQPRSSKMTWLKAGNRGRSRSIDEVPRRGYKGSGASPKGKISKWAKVKEAFKWEKVGLDQRTGKTQGSSSSQHSAQTSTQKPSVMHLQVPSTMSHSDQSDLSPDYRCDNSFYYSPFNSSSSSEDTDWGPNWLESARFGVYRERSVLSSDSAADEDRSSKRRRHSGSSAMRGASSSRDDANARRNKHHDSDRKSRGTKLALLFYQTQDRSSSAPKRSSKTSPIPRNPRDDETLVPPENTAAAVRRRSKPQLTISLPSGGSPSHRLPHSNSTSTLDKQLRSGAGSAGGGTTGASAADKFERKISEPARDQRTSRQHHHHHHGRRVAPVAAAGNGPKPKISLNESPPSQRQSKWTKVKKAFLGTATTSSSSGTTGVPPPAIGTSTGNNLCGQSNSGAGKSVPTSPHIPSPGLTESGVFRFDDDVSENKASPSMQNTTAHRKDAMSSVLPVRMENILELEDKRDRRLVPNVVDGSLVNTGNANIIGSVRHHSSAVDPDSARPKNPFNPQRIFGDSHRSRVSESSTIPSAATYQAYESIQKNLSVNFTKKLDEWAKMRNSGTTSQRPSEHQIKKLPQDFTKKLQEWEKKKAMNASKSLSSAGGIITPSPKPDRKSTSAAAAAVRSQPKQELQSKFYSKEEKSSGKHSNKEKDMAWLEKELKKIEREKRRLEREKEKFLRREARLEQIKMALRTPEDENHQREILVRTASGACLRFGGISRSFARRLLEWEERQGISPEASAMALLHKPGKRLQTVEIITSKPKENSLLESSGFGADRGLSSLRDAHRRTSKQELSRKVRELKAELLKMWNSQDGVQPDKLDEEAGNMGERSWQDPRLSDSSPSTSGKNGLDSASATFPSKKSTFNDVVSDDQVADDLLEDPPSFRELPADEDFEEDSTSLSCSKASNKDQQSRAEDPMDDDESECQPTRHHHHHRHRHGQHSSTESSVVDHQLSPTKTPSWMQNDEFDDANNATQFVIALPSPSAAGGYMRKTSSDLTSSTSDRTHSPSKQSSDGDFRALTDSGEDSLQLFEHQSSSQQRDDETPPPCEEFFFSLPIGFSQGFQLVQRTEADEGEDTSQVEARGTNKRRISRDMFSRQIAFDDGRGFANLGKQLSGASEDTYKASDSPTGTTTLTLSRQNSETSTTNAVNNDGSGLAHRETMSDTGDFGQSPAMSASANHDTCFAERFNALSRSATEVNSRSTGAGCIFSSAQGEPRLIDRPEIVPTQIRKLFSTQQSSPQTSRCRLGLPAPTSDDDDVDADSKIPSAAGDDAETQSIVKVIVPTTKSFFKFPQDSNSRPPA
ncbi:unnamed protein product, partial [Notodromas monacha]